MPPTRHPDHNESGFMLVAVVVMVALVLIALAVAAPVVSRQLRRDKEIESQHRMQQYVRAIQLYQRLHTNQYPPSIKALESTNNVRFLRKQYIDPLTGKADYKLIHQGEQKTKIKVFGKTLEELNVGLGGGLGSAAGISSGIGPSPSCASGPTTALGAGFNNASSGCNNNPSSPGGATGTTGTTGSTGSSGTGIFGDSSGGIIVGVGTSKSGTSVTQPNEQETYETWEYWYDPRIENLKKGVSITGGGISSGAATSLGGLPGATGTTAPPTTTPAPNQ